MKDTTYRWDVAGRSYTFDLAHVPGTQGDPYTFGTGTDRRRVDIDDFAIGRCTVTGALWTHIMQVDNPSSRGGNDLPLENVSWLELTSQGGFLDRLNASAVHTRLADTDERFRLPTETEWEYAARGGQHWRDDYQFSGSNDAELVAWYDRRHGDHTQPVGQKLPNQLGLYDMSGNVWEWCEDVHTTRFDEIPTDGSPCRVEATERVLRGGCFHNWAVHCTVSKRYSIEPHHHDGCIGVRVALAHAS